MRDELSLPALCASCDLLARLSRKVNREALFQAHPLCMLIALMENHTREKDHDAPSCTDPQGKHERDQQDSTKAASKHAIDDGDHPCHREEALDPESVH